MNDVTQGGVPAMTSSPDRFENSRGDELGFAPRRLISKSTSMSFVIRNSVTNHALDRVAVTTFIYPTVLHP
jgi:hypothetical protein